MIDEKMMIAYGPVPSRRLGQSIGINNIPPKICTYSCIYCQLGRTLNMQIKRQTFYKPEKVVEAVKRKIQRAKENQESIDYLTFVPDGEPTFVKYRICTSYEEGRREYAFNKSGERLEYC